MTRPRRSADSSLDALNFFLADVRDGLGPYLAIYLLTVQQWNEATIGLVMTIGGIAGIIAQSPAGALIDAARAKRALIVAAAALVTIASVLLPFVSGFFAVAATQFATGAAASIFQPAIAAITLGVVGPRAFAKRTGRNEAFNHAGNAVAAILAGVSAYVFGPIAVFWLMSIMAIASIVATLSIPADLIDHDLARGLREGDARNDQPSSLKALMRTPSLTLFAICVVLFHFANAAMLPLVGQKLALLNKDLATTLMSACIVAAQIIMIPIAIIVGAKANDWGRKPLFLAAFAVLALRGALYAASDNPYWLVAVQSLDGVGAGVFGALFPLIVNDLTKGLGRFNLAQGAIATALGIGASLSTSAAGLLVVRFGYDAAFLFLAGVAAVGTMLFGLLMPETRSADQRDRSAEPRLPDPARA